jgi:hypothetical protein
MIGGLVLLALIGSLIFFAVKRRQTEQTPDEWDIEREDNEEGHYDMNAANLSIDEITVDENQFVEMAHGDSFDAFVVLGEEAP